MTSTTNEEPEGEPKARHLEVGTIGKPHGLKGEVVVDFVTNRIAERTAPGTELWIDDEKLVITRARPHQNRWLVFFDGIADRTGAERLRGSVLSAPAIDDPDAVFVHEVIGKTVIDQHGVDHGEVVSVIANPASDLLELEDGRLVPLAFYERDDGDAVHVNVPAGLLDDGE